MISYSVSLSLIMVSVIFLAGSVDLVHVMTTQTGISFGIALLPIAILFMISAIAETNRAPFDLPEAESELATGYFDPESIQGASNIGAIIISTWSWL